MSSSSQANLGNFDFKALFNQLAPEPEPDMKFILGDDREAVASAGLSRFKVFFTRFAARFVTDRALQENFTSLIAARSALRGQMIKGASERFVNRLRELQSTGQMSQDAVSQAIYGARTRIVLRYSDEEAIEVVRKGAHGEPLTLREEGILLHIAPAHPETYAVQAGLLGMEAQQLLEKKQTREAIDLLDAACEIHPVSADQVLKVGTMLAASGEVKRAIARLEEGFQHFPDNWKIPYNVACYYCRLGDLQMGVRCLARSFQLNSAETTSNLAQDPDLAPLRSADLAQLLGQALAAAATSTTTPASSARTAHQPSDVTATPTTPTSGQTAATPDPATAPASAASSARRAPQAANPEWFYSFDGRARMGPVSAEQLKELVAQRSLTPEAFVSRDGKSWQKASRLKGVQWPKT